MSLIPKACFFTGHRVINRAETDKIRSRLNEEILGKINDGVEVFITGGALGFDTIAAEQVIFMRGDYPGIKLCLYLPCENQDSEWLPDDRDRYRKIKAQADEVYYVTKTGYTEGCMKKRNRAMVEAADCGIAYLLARHSGSYQTVRMAHSKGIEVVNIADLLNDE